MFITFCLVIGATVVMGAQQTVEIKVDVAAPKDVSVSGIFSFPAHPFYKGNFFICETFITKRPQKM